MADFDTLLADYTKKENPVVHGVICKCVDKNGNEIYSKISGYNSISPDASPLREDAVLKAASSTKLFTSIALLQCVEKGLIGLDESLTKILPELDHRAILTDVSEAELISKPSTIQITPRHLLSHTSGFGYRFLHPLLIKWSQTPAGQKHNGSHVVTEKYDYPLVFEPGTGWLYGCSLDWAGIAVSRLNNGISLGDYMVENMWKKLGLSSPFPTFNISTHPEYSTRLMQGAARDSDSGRLTPFDFPFLENPEGQEGGGGIAFTTKDCLAVLTDLISDSPKLLKPETIAEMFTPQLAADSPGIPMLIQLRPAWEVVAGPVSNESVNHGLGGLLIQGEAPEICQPANILAWGGASNNVWFACKEKGVAGLFATQINPFGDAKVHELMNAWRRDFWTGYNKQGSLRNKM